jgi:hypothetical protein
MTKNTINEQKKNYYDFIIIGSGLAGLYSAYLIKKMNYRKTILILDKEKKAWIGGRTGDEMFYNNEVVTGAGVGRLKKDYLLVKLLKEFKIPVQKCTIKMNYAKTIPYTVNVIKVIEYLKKIYKKDIKGKDINKNPINETFKEFALPILGPENYKIFTICAGYTDYENEDVHEVLFNYGMDDNYPGWTSLILSWKLLVQRLIDYIGSNNVKSLHKAIKINKLDDNENNNGFLFQTICENKQIFYSNKVIIATTISSLINLLPSFKIYDQIKGQPFLRVYGKFTAKSGKMLDKYVPYQTLVPGPLHKIIPLKNNVFMIAYTDNKGALDLKDHIENTKTNRIFFEHLLEQSLGIPKNTLDLIAIKGFYWPVGTHYYTKLSGYKSRDEFIYKAQHPLPGILVVGEMVSLNQGWTEGALESVEAVKKDLLN